MERNKEQTAEVKGVLRKRDILVFALLLVATLMSWSTKALNYELAPSWYHSLDKSDVASNNIPGAFSVLPPLVTDLNGDGSNEVIVVTPSDVTLKILYTSEIHSHVYQPDVIASVKLTHADIYKGRRPLLFKTGYIERYKANEFRKQVIVVVLEDFTVLCYDNNLNLLWEKAVAHNSHAIDKFIDSFSMKELSIFITPISLSNSSTGTIFVGSSMELTKPVDIHLEKGIDLNENGVKEHEEMEVQSLMEHFSIYALDASNGHVIWRHDGMDVRPEQFYRSLPRNAYKVDMSDLMPQLHHSASSSHSKTWSIFRQSLLAQLPHFWNKLDDTSFTVSHFEKKHIGAGANAQNKKTNQMYDLKSRVKPSVNEKHKRKVGDLIAGKSKRFAGLEYPPLDKNAELPHDVLEHLAHPNVLVAHTSSGLEVVSLASGNPISSLPLPAGKFYTDLNGDGIVDSIILLNDPQAVEAHSYDYANHFSTFKHCSILVISGMPAKSQLFNGSLCQKHNSLNDPFLKHLDHSGKLPARVSSSEPVVMQVIDEKSGLLSQYKDVVVAVNNGIVTSYRGDGEFQWQVSDGPEWDVDFKFGSAVAYDIDASRVAETGLWNSPGSYILAVGDSKMNMISSEGYTVTMATLPAKPSGKPILGDFDSDGVMDVIVVTDDAILGYRLEVMQGERYAFIACIFISALIVLSFINGIRKEVVTAGSAKKGVMSIIRSTDSLHID